MKIINLTPHQITILTSNGVLAIEPSGKIARVKEERKLIEEKNGIKFFKTNYSDVTDLPDEEENTILIVSAMVAGRLKGRKDVFYPCDFVRDENGRIKGCKGLTK